MEHIATAQIKKSQKSHTCNYCHHEIPIGSKYKLNTFAQDGGIARFKECECCEAFMVDHYLEVFDRSGETVLDSFMDAEAYPEFRKIFFAS